MFDYHNLSVFMSLRSMAIRVIAPIAIMSNEIRIRNLKNEIEKSMCVVLCIGFVQLRPIETARPPFCENKGDRY